MIWMPNICSGGQCQLKWESGDLWTPNEPWEFLSGCSEHGKYPDKTQTLLALKTENQAMSYGRAAVAQILNILVFDNSSGQFVLDDAGSTINFGFDAQRNIILTVPQAYKQALVSKGILITSALSKISPNLSVV